MWKLAAGSVLVFVIGIVAAAWMAEPMKVAHHIDFCLSCGGAKYRIIDGKGGVTLKPCWSCTKRNTPKVAE